MADFKNFKDLNPGEKWDFIEAHLAEIYSKVKELKKKKK